VEDLIDSLTNGNTPGVKVVLTSVALALGGYQLILAAIGYRKLRPPAPQPEPAFVTHRASGHVIATLIVLVAVACLGAYGFEDDLMLHAVAGAVLVGLLAFKVAVVRRGLGLGRGLPLFGITVFLLLGVTWLTAAPEILDG
jgi:hypothetical protein